MKKDNEKQINTQGIGLGLVISKLIIEKFGGTINFCSEYEVGTTFTFTFPLQRPEFNELREFKKKHEERNS